MLVNLMPAGIQQKSKEGPKWGKIENNEIWLYFQNKLWKFLWVHQNFFNIIITLKIAQKNPKRLKENQT